MLMRVRERGDEVHIELSGLAGRQQRVLQALSECRRDVAGASSALGSAEVSVRAGYDDMRICLKGGAGVRFEPATIYRCLRRALLEQPIRHGASVGAAAVG